MDWYALILIIPLVIAVGYVLYVKGLVERHFRNNAKISKQRMERIIKEQEK